MAQKQHSRCRDENRAADPFNLQLLALVERIKAQDESAFAEFYDLTVKKLYSIAYHIIGNDEDAEEIICDVYTQIWQNIQSYDKSKGAVLAWCFVITRSRSLDKYRVNKTRSERLSENAEDWIQLQQKRLNQDDPRDLLSVNSFFWLCLECIGLEQRNLLSLSLINGLSHKEIAEITGHPIGTIKSHISRSLKKINQFITDREDNDQTS